MPAFGAHVWANYDAGPLDARYETAWAGMSEIERWVTGLTETVGPSPPLAPGVLGQIGLALLLASYRHPALTERPGR
ncbi:MAG: hypothetical protein EXR51_10320 [Dehalococcoidia bacterium]|nr:hypothetical protein [Dehalococcoidia bacterium]